MHGEGLVRRWITGRVLWPCLSELDDCLFSYYSDIPNGELQYYWTCGGHAVDVRFEGLKDCNWHGVRRWVGGVSR